MRPLQKNVLIYGDSMTWGIIPDSRNRLPFQARWPGVLQQALGEGYRIIEECLNGRTTAFEETRPSRNGLESVDVVLQSHSPLDLVVVCLGVNDFQDCVGVDAKESAEGLRFLAQKVLSSAPEPMQAPPKLLCAIQPDIQKAMGAMAEKFTGVDRGRGSEIAKISAIKDLKSGVFLMSDHVEPSRVDGVHIDADDHVVLGSALAPRIKELLIS